MTSLQYAREADCSLLTDESYVIFMDHLPKSTEQSCLLQLMVFYAKQ